MTFEELMRRHLQDIKGWAEFQRRAEREAGIRAETIERIASDFETMLDKWESETRDLAANGWICHE